MKLSVLFVLLTLVSTSTQAQKFYQTLAQLSYQVDSNRSIKIDYDSLLMVLHSTKNKSAQIDPNAVYRPFIYHGIHQKDIVGVPIEINKSSVPQNEFIVPKPAVVNSFSQKTKTKRQQLKLASISTQTFTGAQLIDSTSVGTKRVSKEELTMQIGRIYERNHPLNGVWTVTAFEDVLLFRYVHSYPNGNMTSWYIEEQIFLRKIHP